MTTASFTPTANSYLYIVVTGVSSNDSAAPAWSVSGGGLTWNAVAGGERNGSGTFRNDTTTYRAAVGGSPSSMTITVDKYSSSSTNVWYGAAVFDATGLDATSQEDQVDTGYTASGSHTQTRTGTPAEHQVCVWTGELTEGTDDGAWASVDETNWTRVSEKSDTDCTIPTDLWESSNGTLTSMTQSITSSGTEFSVNAVWIELNPSVDVDANAGAATATGSGHDPTARVEPGAGAATGTGSGSDAATAIEVSAGSAGALGAGHDPAASIEVGAGHATGSGSAHDPKLEVGPHAVIATATGAGHDPSTIVTVDGGTASGTGTAHDPQATVDPGAGTGTATGDGHDATARIDPQPGPAVATGTGHDPAVTTQFGALVATATGTAHDATVIVGPAAEVATATGTAYNVGSLTSPAETDEAIGAWFGRLRYTATFESAIVG